MNAQSIKAIVTLLIVCVVNVANVAGFALDYDLWFNVTFSVFSVVSVVYAWWKNQNITKAAQLAQEYLDDLKREKV